LSSEDFVHAAQEAAKSSKSLAKGKKENNIFSTHI
jgi:hypothetical protein